MAGYRDFLPSLRFQSALRLSPDGTRIAYIDDASGQFNLAVQPVSGGKTHRLTGYIDSAVAGAVWHPDGQSLLFAADSLGNERTQLYEVADIGGDPVALTANPSARFTLALGNPFSPDGRYVAYSGNDREPGEQDILVRDRQTGEVRRVYTGGGSMYAGCWSPDATRLSAVDWREGNSDHVVYVLAADGSTATRLTPDGDPAVFGLGPWLPDGSGFLVRSNAGREFTGLAVMDAQSGELTWLDTPEWDVEACALSADGKTLAWLVNVDGASRLRVRELSTGRDLDEPDLPMGVGSDLSLSADGKLVLLGWSSPARPWNVVVVDLVSGTFRQITDSQPVAVDPATFVDPQLVHYRADDGRTIPAYLYMPTKTDGPIGVVLAIHGGPAAQERPDYRNEGFYQYIASRGVAVIAPNVRGSTGYGKTFKQFSHRDWGGGDLQDIAATARYLREQDWVDPTRIGLFGGSYGGFMVLSCLARLAEYRWAAAVDLCGPSNLLTFAKCQPPRWRLKVATLIGDPDTDADFLLSRSPVTYAANMSAPLFVIQGANDPRVPQHESDQIVAMLRDRGVDVRYDVYPDEGHSFSKRENRARSRADAAEFLLAHVGPDRG